MERPLSPGVVRRHDGGLIGKEIHPMKGITTLGIDLAKKARSRMNCNTYGPMWPEVEDGRKVQSVECG